MEVVLTVTAVRLRHISMNISTEFIVVSTRYKGNCVSACSFCSTVTSQCYGYMD